VAVQLSVNTKRNRTRALTAALAIALTGVVVVDSAWAASTPVTEAKRTLIQRVSNYQLPGTNVTASVVGGMALTHSGGVEHAWVVKSNPWKSNSAGTGYGALYHVSNFGTSSATTTAVPIKDNGSLVNLGHANGLAYWRKPGTDYLVWGSFYIPTIGHGGAPQVIQINNQGQVTNKFGAKTTAGTLKNIASITHYKDDWFIVGTTGKVTSGDRVKKEYYTAKISGNNFILHTRFFVVTTQQYSTGQDIYYDSAKDELLVPVVDKSTDGSYPVRKNRIIVAKLGGTITSDHTYEAARWIQLNVSSEDAYRFEFEGLARNLAGNLIVASDIVGPAPSKNPIDGIHKITGK